MKIIFKWYYDGFRMYCMHSEFAIRHIQRFLKNPFFCLWVFEFKFDQIFT